MIDSPYFWICCPNFSYLKLLRWCRRRDPDGSVMFSKNRFHVEVAFSSYCTSYFWFLMSELPIVSHSFKGFIEWYWWRHNLVVDFRSTPLALIIALLSSWLIELCICCWVITVWGLEGRFSCMCCWSEVGGLQRCGVVADSHTTLLNCTCFLSGFHLHYGFRSELLSHCVVLCYQWFSDLITLSSCRHVMWQL